MEDPAAKPPLPKSRIAPKVIASVFFLTLIIFMVIRPLTLSPAPISLMIVPAYMAFLIASALVAIFVRIFARDGWKQVRRFFFIAWLAALVLGILALAVNFLGHMIPR